MKFSYNWLKEFFDKKPASTRRGEPMRGGLPEPKKLADLLTMHSFEVESVNKKGSDWILDIDILPNRIPYAASHQGVAKEIATILKISNFQFPIFKQNKKQKSTPSSDRARIKVEIKDKDLCPRYTALEIKGIKVGPSPKWLKQKLEACGINSINNVVDAGNYVMLELGQPLHVFDARKLGNKIVVRSAKKGEKIETLDDQKYNLDHEVLVIADSKEPVAIAGIKGGKETGVDKKTKDIVLEAANFNPVTIRNGSKKLDLKTDASLRFSTGLDPNLTEKAIWRLGELIGELAGGEISESTVDVYPKKVVSGKIKLDFNKVRSLLGVDISDKKIKDILKSLDIKEARRRKSVFNIPTIRRDLQIQEDLIEEVGRIYGYENIKPQHPRGELVPAEQADVILWRDKIKNHLLSFGFTEVYNYSFIDDREIKFLPKGMKKNLIELENPVRPDSRFLKPALTPRLLTKAVFNLRNFKRIKMFETGFVFGNQEKRKKKDVFGLQNENLALIIATGEVKEGDNILLEIKGIVSSLLESLGVANAWFDSHPDASLSCVDMHPYRSTEIKAGDKPLGVLGDISPETKRELGLEGVVVFAEFCLDDLINAARAEMEFSPISRFPSIMRDIAILVPFRTRVAEILDVIEVSGGDFLTDVDLFDAYEGRELPQGKKNFAFRLIFQSHDKTLTDEEVAGFMEAIIKEIEKNPNWEIRK